MLNSGLDYIWPWNRTWRFLKAEAQSENLKLVWYYTTTLSSVIFPLFAIMVPAY